VKTVTVRDLRNHFAKISAWLDQGEEIIITKRGHSFARILPLRPNKPPGKTEFRDRLRTIYGDKVLKNPILQERATAKW
jgi:antitoxin (DNA-binding transcriptional repressor) of toxin-antitoxin stability system